MSLMIFLFWLINVIEEKLIIKFYMCMCIVGKYGVYNMMFFFIDLCFGLMFFFVFLWLLVLKDDYRIVRYF